MLTILTCSLLGQSYHAYSAVPRIIQALFASHKVLYPSEQTLKPSCACSRFAQRCSWRCSTHRAISRRRCSRRKRATLPRTGARGPGPWRQASPIPDHESRYSSQIEAHVQRFFFHGRFVVQSHGRWLQVSISLSLRLSLASVSKTWFPFSKQL